LTRTIKRKMKISSIFYDRVFEKRCRVAKWFFTSGR